MASQLFGVTGNKRIKRNQGAELNARLKHLPTILANEQKADQIARDESFRQKQFKQQKQQDRKTLDFESEQAKRGFGLEMGKLGVNVATSGFGSGTMGGMYKKAINMNDPTSAPGPERAAGGASNEGGGYFSNINTGSVISGGLAGFGMGTMFDKKKKSKKMLLGAGAGMLTGMLSGGFSGGLGGGIAGLFGGMLS